MKIVLSSQGGYSNFKHSPSFTLFDGIKVPEDSIALLNVNRVMMNQPKLLDESMVLKITAKKASGSTTVFTVNLKDVSQFDRFSEYCIPRDNKELSNYEYAEYLTFLLNVINSKFLIETGRDFFFKVSQGANTFDSSVINGIPDVTEEAELNTPGQGLMNYYVAAVMNNHTMGTAKLMFATRNEMVVDTLTSVTLQGSFLKVFDLDPQESVTIPFGGSIPIKVQSQGHDYFMIRSNQCKNCLDNLKKNTQPLFSNVLAVIPCGSTGFINYDVQHTGNKIQLNGRSLDTLELLFQDKWGRPLLGIRDFYVELTLDFLVLGALKEKANLMEFKKM